MGLFARKMRVRYKNDNVKEQEQLTGADSDAI